ncbi:MAG: maltose alpha-D-glucosyltransferase [Candidatus Sulfopaludibacter sp.]|nr:maltose alpha-D-glucosyltransferase [Candidatus Sulfopaludibacter sp.]
MKRFGSATDPRWYKDAVIYELHLRAFFDSDNDGIGDFPGLIQKLDYLQDLGVTCLWLLPFFPSPLKDDGYDISDYVNVHPMYGTIEDFRTFLAAAHERGLQVMIELVMNHTSDQHPWFQRARQAPSGSPERDYYVWSDTNHKYGEARIIFTDTEKSNWTWDPVAQAYFWHRFFSHQPDLNYDNPKVVEEMLNVVRYWLDLGVDALRIDAIPYLLEREGTSCENLPETHLLVKNLRQEIDAGYENRMILAEANQWPTDVRPYFGDGDECHMAFHFPLMPRIYMALRQEDRLPITDIMAQTPQIPDSCQWALFLRNHDELTLEMVTNDERDYMYLAYSGDPRMRLNLGIRRRLATLMDNNRRRIELLNSLLFSFPGTPIVYYGDEIGMGDNIYLGDRNGVRTPMQWNADRNAGFSRAIPAKLYSPVIMDPILGYEAVNVEAQQGDPASLLSWMRNMIALRKLFRVFGRGTLEFLNPSNRKVLAYLRSYEEQQVLCVANLSRFAQPVDLELPQLEGATPVEMLGYVDFPPIGKQPYRLTLGPYGFLWLEMHDQPKYVDSEAGPAASLPVVAESWESLLEGAGRYRLESTLLPEYLPKQRWFGGKARRIGAVRIADWAALADSNAVLILVEVQYEKGAPDTYFVPLGLAFGKDADQVRETAPTAILSSAISPDGPGVLYDAVYDDRTAGAFLSFIAHAGQAKSRNGLIRGAPGVQFAALRGPAETPLAARRASAEQSNTSLFYGDRLILKLFRRQQPGPNPDCEIGQYLTEKAHFDGVPQFAGAIEYVPADGVPATLAMLQGLVSNQGDGWTLTLEELARYYENCATVTFPEGGTAADGDLLELAEQEPTQLARDHVGIALDSAAKLGQRTAELHLALAHADDDPAFTPEALDAGEAQSLLTNLREDATRVLDLLKDSFATLPDEIVDLAGLVLGRRRQILDSFRLEPKDGAPGQRIRIHGDYHLGQVLQVKTGYVILDFEGEPARPVAERRAKGSPLKDVAGMLRSLGYAAYSGLLAYTARRPEDWEKLELWARLWERSMGAAFLRAYRNTAQSGRFLPSRKDAFRKVLAIYLLDKALYELSYELNNRPTWVRIPLMGILSLPMEAGGREWNWMPSHSRN